MPTPVALTIAGSDCSAGAGAQADLKTFSSHSVFGLTAVTCVVAEIPGLVERVQPVEPELVAAQIRLLLAHYPVAAIKTGMLFSREILLAAVGPLRDARARGALAPLVVDPVMVASSGDRLLSPDAIQLYIDALIPLASLVTPNLDEAAILLGAPIRDREEMLDAAPTLAARLGVPVLLKGGHLRDDVALDLLAWHGQTLELAAPYDRSVDPHGTGCTYSAAITANLAVGKPLDAAARDAKTFITRAIRSRHVWPGPQHPITALDQSCGA